VSRQKPSSGVTQPIVVEPTRSSASALRQPAASAAMRGMLAAHEVGHTLAQVHTHRDHHATAPTDDSRFCHSLIHIHASPSVDRWSAQYQPSYGPSTAAGSRGSPARLRLHALRPPGPFEWATRHVASARCSDRGTALVFRLSSLLQGGPCGAAAPARCLCSARKRACGLTAGPAHAEPRQARRPRRAAEREEPKKVPSPGRQAPG